MIASNLLYSEFHQEALEIKIDTHMQLKASYHYCDSLGEKQISVQLEISYHIMKAFYRSILINGFENSATIAGMQCDNLTKNIEINQNQRPK